MLHPHLTPPSVNQGTPKTILLVEDEALIALNEKVILQKHGFTVLMAANGAKAVDIALHTPPLDLILMDINLGSGMDGTEAAQQILAQRDVPIVFLSSHTEPDVVEKTEKITSYGYVVKSSGETVLLASIKMAFKLFDAHQRLKQQEAALRESEALLNATGHIAKVGGWELDAHTLEVRWTEETYHIHDVPLDYKPSLQGAINFFHPEDQGKLADAIQRALNDGEPYNLELRFITATGKHLWTRTICKPLIVDGKVLTLKGIFQDISDRRRTEEALQQSEAQKQAILDGITTNIAFVNEQLEILWVNKTAAESANKTPEEMLGFKCYELWADPNKPCENCPTVKAFQTQQSEHVTMRTPDGRIWDERGAPVFDAEGTLLGVVEIAQDITDRKRAEEALRESERQLRELNAQKDKFFSILAHDLKNPLTGFLSFANLLEHDFNHMPFEERTMLIQHFRTSAETLFTLLENLLTWAHLQQGQVESFPVQFPLDPLVVHAVELLTPNAEQKQITLTNATPPVEVYANVAMVDTVVRNLIGNAIKFTPPGGTVTITATATAQEVCVTVADTGIGIPPDKLDQLFRIDGNTQHDGTNGEQGTGLGLILCKEFVEQQGGAIWVESEVGQGTRCQFTLPRSAG